MKFAIAAVVMLSSQLALANVMNVAIDCKSASGRTIVHADVPGDDPDASIAVSLDGKKSSFMNADAKVLADAGNQSMMSRITGGEILAADILVANDDVAATPQTQPYALSAVVNNQTVFSLVAKRPLRLAKDRDYGYRSGPFAAKLHAVVQGHSFGADVRCDYDYAP